MLPQILTFATGWVVGRFFLKRKLKKAKVVKKNPDRLIWHVNNRGHGRWVSARVLNRRRRGGKGR